MTPKIYHLTSVHPEQDTRILHKECATLARAGYDVSLIVKSDKNKIVDNVKIFAIQDEKSRFKRMLFTIWSVYKKAISGDADIYHFHDAELIPVGMLLRLKGKKVIYDVHEDLPRQILSKPWISSWLRYPASYAAALIEWLGARLFFSGIVAATPKIVERFPKHKSITVQNFPILGELVRREPSSYMGRPMNVVYVGNITKTRSAIEKVVAIGLVQKTNSRLIFAGIFENKRLENECGKLHGWEKVEYRGWLNRKELTRMLDNARVGLVLLHPIVNYLDSYPVKLFEYMSAGIPVIASDFPLWRNIVGGVGCGLLADPKNPQEIARAIDWLFDHPEEAEKMGANGRRAVIERFNWPSEEEKLLDFYGKLTQ